MGLAGQVRPDFSVFRREDGSPPPALFDGPGGSQVPRQVVRAIADYLEFHNANTHGFFPTSRETDAVISGARERLATFVGASSPEEIVFGANMTTLTFALARSLAREWEPGDEIIVTRLDHQANVAPWQTVAAERGVRVHQVPFDRESLTLDYAALEGFLGPRVRLLAVGAASNAVGTINDVGRVAAAARAVGALSFVDAVHYAPHRATDVQAIGCDFLACSAYKFFGPHVGVLWGRTEHLNRLHPAKVPPASNTVPERWETGTQNHEGIAGAAAAVEWISGLADAGGSERSRLVRAMERIDLHETACMAMLLEGLSGIDGVRLYTPARGDSRTPTVAFTLDGHSAGEIAQWLAGRGVAVWSGDFYASTVVDDLGLRAQGGLVRAGIAPYTTEDDVGRLIRGVEELQRG